MFGGNLRARLFENFTDDENAFFIEEAIKEVLTTYEPRAQVLSVDVNDSYVDRNYLGITVEFQIVNTEETVVLETNISRIR